MSNEPIQSLRDFLQASRDRSQAEVLREFLTNLIRGNHVSESGSISVFNPSTKKLELFNEGDFLFKSGLLKKGEPWQHEFDPGEGLAGLAFRTRETRFTNDASEDPRFSATAGSVPIKAIICIPIIVSRISEPFGVVSFHNSEEGRVFKDEHRLLLEAYVDALGFALAASKQLLESKKNTKIFIVHGRDDVSRWQLQSLLQKYGAEPIVLLDLLKTGAEILEMLEDQIACCAGGFVLLTPDDEGRLYGDPKLELDPRARENVIFEGGYLVARFRSARRVCFLAKSRVKLPSDLRGMLLENCDSIDSCAVKIKDILRSWGIPLKEEA